MMDTDEALERFNREHPELFQPRRNATPIQPRRGHGEFQARPTGDTPCKALRRQIEDETSDRSSTMLIEDLRQS